jgi:hypothetical protein
MEAVDLAGDFAGSISIRDEDIRSRPWPRITGHAFDKSGALGAPVRFDKA